MPDKNMERFFNRYIVRLIVLFLLYSEAGLSQIRYPVARKEKFDTLIYDTKLSDEYFWMSRAANEKEMLDFCKQQGQLAQRIFDSIPGTEAIEKDLGEVFAAAQDDVWNMRKLTMSAAARYFLI